ncbi:unnamed protein product, partial [marine sediment metagenome]
KPLSNNEQNSITAKIQESTPLMTSLHPQAPSPGPSDETR